MRRLFAHHERGRRRTGRPGARDDARFALEKKETKTLPPLGSMLNGVGSQRALPLIDAPPLPGGGDNVRKDHAYCHEGPF